MAHSIKGMASSLDYDSVASLAHCVEDWLEPLRDAGVVPDSALPLLYETLSAFEQMVSAVEETGAPPPARDDLLARLSEPAELIVPVEEAGPAKKAGKSARRPYRAPSACAPRRSTASWHRWVS
jgi:two-component system chemotaxis sensor kinase CheA